MPSHVSGACAFLLCSDEVVVDGLCVAPLIFTHFSWKDCECVFLLPIHENVTAMPWFPILFPWIPECTESLSHMLWGIDFGGVRGMQSP